MGRTSPASVKLSDQPVMRPVRASRVGVAPAAV